MGTSILAAIAGALPIIMALIEAILENRKHENDIYERLAQRSLGELSAGRERLFPPSNLQPK